MIKKLKKGFTIVELVIVIAVIAILAAILIPTFSGIIKKANIASDTAMAKNMNTALVMADSEGNVPEDMGDVLFILYEAGYALKNLNPTTNGYYFVWDETTNQILFLTDQFEVHYSSKTYSKDTLNWWMPVDEASDVIKGKKFSYTLAADLTESFTFDYLANFDTNDFILNGNLTYTSTDTGSFSVEGIIRGTLTINTPNANVNHRGTVDNVVVTAVAEASYHEYGFIKQVLTAIAGRVVIENSGNVMKLTIGSNTLEVQNDGVIEDLNVDFASMDQASFDAVVASIVNKGFVKKLSSAVTANVIEVTGKQFAPSSTNTEAGQSEGFSVKIGTLNQLESFRDAINAGMTAEGLVIELTSDIDLTGQAWTPIGWTSRKLTTDPTMFRGIFEGNNHTIKGLSTSGFTPTSEGIREDNYVGATEKNYVFGLFGIAHNAEFRNLKLTNVDIHELNNGYRIDSAGSLLGFSVGSLTVKNVSASGVITGTDGLSGIVGRAYSSENRGGTTFGDANAKLKIENVTNNLTVTMSPLGSQKGAGIVGFVSGSGSQFDFEQNVKFINCINNGDIAAKQYVAAGIAVFHKGATVVQRTAMLKDCVNNGKITDKHGIDQNKLTEINQ